jgi:hypothetical protein
VSADAYDEITLKIGEADAMMEHLAEQLGDDSGAPTDSRLYALSLIAGDIRTRFAEIGDKLAAMVKGGA